MYEDVGVYGVSKPKIAEGQSMDTVLPFSLPRLVGMNYKGKKKKKKHP